MPNGVCFQLDQIIAERDAAIAQRDEGIALANAERDAAIAEANAERDFILTMVQDIGLALCKSRNITIKPTKRGVEARVLYPTLLDALRARAHVARLRAMVLLGPRPNDAALEAAHASAEESRMHA
jgi:hypothetical protein